MIQAAPLLSSVDRQSTVIHATVTRWLHKAEYRASMMQTASKQTIQLDVGLMVHRERQLAAGTMWLTASYDDIVAHARKGGLNSYHRHKVPEAGIAALIRDCLRAPHAA
jgi:hypothetical protein